MLGKKARVQYICSSCGTHTAGAMGRCPGCGEWGTIEAETTAPTSGVAPRTQTLHTEQLAAHTGADLARRSSGFSEVDRVLGGGWVAGAALLIAGEPGIGKSTLLLQLAEEATKQEQHVFYLAGEEAVSQLRLRANRLGLAAAVTVSRETNASVVADWLVTERPPLAIIDSIQTLIAADGEVPGTPTQLRDATAALIEAARQSGTTLVLIGHVTKQGTIAGPKIIEHMVDATFALEAATGYRVLRAVKNRFGPSGEMGVFEMTSTGMVPVENPSEVFLRERLAGVPGSAVSLALEGHRPLLLEIQALASKTPYAAPRRVVQGLDNRRIDLILAVLERRLELPLTDLDVFVNVAGGLRLTDPGADLAVAAAVYSAVTNQALPSSVAVVGEIGLTGELRSVNRLAERYEASKRAGFDRIIGPATDDGAGVRTLQEALSAIWKTK